MAFRETPHITEFYKTLEGWTDQRFITREQIQDLAMFTLHLVNLAEDDGWSYDGHSYKSSLPMGCLVVRGTVDGTPSVVFTSGRTYIGCVRMFLRKLEGELLEWRIDKFRQ